MLERMQRNRFLVLGRAGMDLYAEPPGTAVEHARRFFACLGGSSGNIAAALSRQGARVAMLSCLSDDAVGRFTREALHAFEVETEHVRTVRGAARTNLAVVDTRGDATQAVIYRNDAADFALTRQDVAAVDYGAFGALIATGTALAAEPSRSATLHAFNLARRACVPVVFDIDYRPYSWPSAAVAQEVYTLAGGFWPGIRFCIVDLPDLAHFVSGWLLSTPGLPGDLIGNDGVNLYDYNYLATYWLRACPDNWPWW